MVRHRGIARPLKRKRSPLSPPTSKRLPSLRSLHKSIITIQVGPTSNPETFLMHKELVALHSTTLAGMMTEPIKTETPGTPGIITLSLPTHSPELFRIFEAFIYRQPFSHINDFSTATTTTLLGAVSLYLFAESLGSPSLQNVSLDCIHDLLYNSVLHTSISTFSLDPRTLNNIWKQTAATSPLRTLLVDILVYDMTLDECVEFAPGYPPDLVVQLLVACKRRLPDRLKGEEAPWEAGMETYYVKGDFTKEVE